MVLAETDECRAAVERHRNRFKDKLKANTLLCLSLDGPIEAQACGLSVGHWRWGVANATKSTRERIAARCSNSRHQPLQIQYVFGQNILTRELLETLVPVDLDNPTYSGRYVTSYLREVVIPARSISQISLVKTSATSGSPTRCVVAVYYGSATAVEGEAGRFLQHEQVISLGHDIILSLREDWQRTKVLHFHALATMEGTQHRFFALHRFPQVPNNLHVGFHCRALALVCENTNLLCAQKLDISSSNP
jgi:hypothetical protein